MARIDDAAADLVGRYAALGRFSGVVCVGAAGEVLGSASHPGQLTPDVPFAVGSISKAFTAVAALQLAADGTLSLDDPIARHLGDLAPDYADVVTIEHLMTHQSAIPSLFKPHMGIEDLPDDLAAAPATRAALAGRFRTLPLRFTPGARTEYSNSGYALLAMIVERAADRDYWEYIDARVLGPAGFETRQHDGHPVPLSHRSWRLGSGDVTCSARDLIRWDGALRSRALLDRAGLARFEQLTQHTSRGALPGRIAAFHRLREPPAAAVVFIDAVPGWGHVPYLTRQADELAGALAALAGGAARIALKRAPSIPPASGTWTLEDGRTFHIQHRAGALHLETDGWALAGLAVPPDPRAESRVAAVIQALSDRRFDAAVAMFAPPNAAQLTPEHLAALWDAVAGPDTTWQLLALVDGAGFAALSTHPTAALRVALDEYADIIGIHTVAADQGPIARTFALRAGDGGTWFTDGFAAAVPDVHVAALAPDRLRLTTVDGRHFDTVNR